MRALEHHSEAREALYALPGLKVVVPSGPRNARSLLVAAIRDPDPVVFLEPKRSYRAFKEEVPDEEEVGVIGRAEVVREGSDVTVVSWGAMMRPVLEAAEGLAGQASVEVVDLLTLHPMDVGTVAASATVTVRSRVGGALQEVHFSEGEEVRKDQILFRIDPRPFEQALRQAEARTFRRYESPACRIAEIIRAYLAGKYQR